MSEELPARAIEATQRFVAAIDSGERADRILAGVLRENSDLTSAERRHVAEWSLGICVWRGRLDAMANGDRSLWLPLFLLDREQRGIEEVASQFGLAAEHLRQALAFQPRVGEAEALAFRRSFPLWLARRWIDQFGLARADAIAAAMNERGPIAIRSAVPREELQQRLKEEGVEAVPSALTSSGLLLRGRPNIFALNAWREGLFEVQDEGSQLIAEAVGATPGERILELCAGSGGKTVAMAEAMRNQGRLLSVDIDARRLEDLKVRLQRHRLTCIETLSADATRVEAVPWAPRSADAVLIDAPCSSLGTLRRSPDARWRLQEGDLAQWASVQRALLAVAQRFVKPGGRLVYATCSIDSTENGAVAGTVEAHDFETVEERQTSPDVEGCDGFYWRVWRRRHAEA